MDGQPSEKDVRREYGKWKARAREFVEDPGKAQGLIRETLAKAKSNKKALGGAWQSLKDILDLLKAWATGRYKTAPKRTILALLGAAIYVLVPVDAIPDFIPGIGLVDDVAVIAMVVKSFRKDLEQFKKEKAN